jgi:hypothetical protein
MMGVMHWLLHLKLAEWQEDARRNLTAKAEMPAIDDVIDTFFTLTNGGKTRISHTDYCGIHLIVAQDKSGYGSLSTHVPADNQPLNSGESESVQCLKLFREPLPPIVCADVEFWTRYALETDLRNEKRKYFRFVGYRVHGQFVFVPEPPSAGHDSKTDDDKYCGGFLMAGGAQIDPRDDSRVPHPFVFGF